MAVFKDELGHKLSPFSPNNNIVLNSSSKDKAPSKFSIQSSLNVCMPGPYQKFSAYAGDNVKVHGATYGHRDENLDEKYETMKRSPMKSPNKKRMKLGKKISPKISRKKPTIRTPVKRQETPELYRYFSRMKKKERKIYSPMKKKMKKNLKERKMYVTY